MGILTERTWPPIRDTALEAHCRQFNNHNFSEILHSVCSYYGYEPNAAKCTTKMQSIQIVIIIEATISAARTARLFAFYSSA